MSDADRQWIIEHAGEQLCDIISSLDYDETEIKIWGLTAIDPTTVEQENGARLSRLSRPGRQASEFGAALTPAGWRLIVCGD